MYFTLEVKWCFLILEEIYLKEFKFTDLSQFGNQNNN